MQRDFIVTCDVCGEEGESYYPSWGMVHTDPRVCAENLKYQAEQLQEQLEKQTNCTKE